MKGKMIVKIIVDIFMTVALLLLMAYSMIGEKAHEWIGAIMFLLFVVHHILNSFWSRNILKGKYNIRRIVQSLIVVLIFFCMAGSMISGIIISRYVFSFLNITSGASWARSVHMLCAYWGFVLMSIHLGFHWNMVIAMMGKITKGRKAWKIAARTMAFVVAIYGIIAFIKRDIGNYMTLNNQFVFFDFTEPVIYFILDYLAVMGLFVAIGHYLAKIMVKKA